MLVLLLRSRYLLVLSTPYYSVPGDTSEAVSLACILGVPWRIEKYRGVPRKMEGCPRAPAVSDPLGRSCLAADHCQPSEPTAAAGKERPSVFRIPHLPNPAPALARRGDSFVPSSAPGSLVISGRLIAGGTPYSPTRAGMCAAVRTSTSTEYGVLHVLDPPHPDSQSPRKEETQKETQLEMMISR